MRASIQDRTDEFRSVIAQVEKRQASSSRAGAQRRALLTDAQKREANGFAKGHVGGAGEGRRARSDFARKAAEIGRDITGTMAKLERLTQRRSLSRRRRHSLMCLRKPPYSGSGPRTLTLRCPFAVAKRKTLFDDRPVEIAELTYIIKQDLSSLNAQISALQSLSKSQQTQSRRNAGADQEGEHNKNVGHRKCLSVRARR